MLDARFSHDGMRVVTASADGTARVWDATTGRLLHILRVGAQVDVPAFAPDDRTILTRHGGRDG